jgi:hypothetical protein
MTSRNIPLPYFPSPPPEYSQKFFAEFLRAFSLYMEAARNPGEGRATLMVLTALQEDDQGLETGALFQQNGFVKIAILNRPHVGGQGVAVSVGAVTVVV